MNAQNVSGIMSQPLLWAGSRDTCEYITVRGIYNLQNQCVNFIACIINLKMCMQATQCKLASGRLESQNLTTNITCMILMLNPYPANVENKVGS